MEQDNEKMTIDDVNLTNNPSPLFPCRYKGCAEEFTYPANMLSMHPEGGVVCEDCWYEYDCYRPEKLEDLPKFTPSLTPEKESRK